MASVSILSDYLRTHDIVLRPTVEQTVNEVLVSLALSSLNVDKGPYRYELISACAVVLNGIPRINDPVLLLENLGNAFERRSGCIYTQTVKQAFERLQTDAVRRGQTKKCWLFGTRGAIGIPKCLPWAACLLITRCLGLNH